MDDRALTKLFVLISIAVIAVAFGWVWSSYFFGQRGLEAVVQERGAQLRKAYEADLELHSQFVHEIAEYVAHDTTVNQLFRAGADAAASGDAAGEQAARQALLNHVNQSWQRLNPHQADRIMHFHLPPATSFLRVHEPDKYGDDLSDVRSTVVEVNNTRKPITGFESGRYFHGIRAVTPVFSKDDAGDEQFVGALEVGVTLSSVLQQLANQSGAHFAVLFDSEHLNERVSAQRLAMYRAVHTQIGSLVMDWSSAASEADAETLSTLLAAAEDANKSTFIHSDWRHTTGASRFPLLEVTVNDAETSEPVGSVLAWFSIDDQIAQLQDRVIRTMIVALLLVIIIEVVLYVGLMRERDLRIERTASLTDALTNISNRRHFDEVLDQEVRRATRSALPLSVILCDIDHFKQYNDFYGHQLGDTCIQQVAQALKKSLRRAGDFVARYGGEEFVVILPDTNLQAAAEVAERLRQAVEALGISHETHASNDVVTISLGVASGRITSIDSGHTLVATADKALYAAKDSGRNRVGTEDYRGVAPVDDQPLTLMYR